MNRLLINILVPLLFVASSPTLADDVAAERARLANQRIQVEAERRAREEEERLEQAQAKAESQVRRVSNPEPVESSEQSGVTRTEPAARTIAARSDEDAVGNAQADRMEMSRVLEQLRELGALRDAGYVTEEEFELLKKKILDSAL